MCVVDVAKYWEKAVAEDVIQTGSLRLKTHTHKIKKLLFLSQLRKQSVTNFITQNSYENQV